MKLTQNVLQRFKVTLRLRKRLIFLAIIDELVDQLENNLEENLFKPFMKTKFYQEYLKASALNQEMIEQEADV
jgi:hypothetical protein